MNRVAELELDFTFQKSETWPSYVKDIFKTFPCLGGTLEYVIIPYYNIILLYYYYYIIILL